MENGRDFLEYLGPDASTSVLFCLDDPADLARLSAVSRSWRRFVIANAFSKNLCLTMWPDVSNFARIKEENNSRVPLEVGSSSHVEWDSLVTDHKIYAYLNHCLVSPIGKRDCITRAIAASSTDNYPDESINNTLIPSDRVTAMPSYWSSGGQSDPQVPEVLTYRLCSKLCVISEIMIQPFEAYFQNDNPIYSAKAVRFRMGYSKLVEDMETQIDQASSSLTADDSNIWTYVSPEFPMAQENTLQSFELPRPVLCIGGIIQVELLGRVQKQEMDDLYYICVCHVKVMGRSLPPIFDVDVLDNSRTLVLKYLSDDQPRNLLKEAQGDESTESERRSPADHVGGAGGGWLLNALLGTIFVADGSGSDEEEGEEDEEG